MEESLLHFIWHKKLFNPEGLTTTTGEEVEILHPGIPNQNQGPDFMMARLRIGEQLWAGHVEIHIRSSAWYLHMHDQDSHYQNVILHVVWEEDQPVYMQDKQLLPCLELASRVDKTLLERYRLLMNNQSWVPCAEGLNTIPDLIKLSWLERLMAERLEQKTTYVLQLFEKCKQDWEQVFYVILLRHLGAPSNSDAMESLALKTPLNMLRKHLDRPDQVEAILFGVAGMLSKETGETYMLHLKREFDFLRKKYQLQPMPSLQWKFMRMRPAHFPTVRIAQAAALLTNCTHFISLLENPMRSEDWIKLFTVTPRDPFWKDHYHFASRTPDTSKTLGRSMAISMIINVVVPVMFIYGKHQGLTALKQKALSLLDELPPESNQVITGWNKVGWSASNAGETQAMLYLKKQYCDQRKCLHCAIGLKILS